MNIKLLSENAIIPTKGSSESAGYDLYSTEDYLLRPLERKLFKTDIALEIPKSYYGRISPRSGLAFKDGLDVMAGIIDADYRGNIGVILINLGQIDKVIKKGDKIAQIIFSCFNEVEKFNVVENLTETTRNEGGYGSTGK